MQDSLPAGGLRLCRAGVEPAGSLREVSAHVILLSRAFPGAMIFRRMACHAERALQVGADQAYDKADFVETCTGPPGQAARGPEPLGQALEHRG